MVISHKKTALLFQIDGLLCMTIKLQLASQISPLIVFLPPDFVLPDVGQFSRAPKTRLGKQRPHSIGGSVCWFRFLRVLMESSKSGIQRGFLDFGDARVSIRYAGYQCLL